MELLHMKIFHLLVEPDLDFLRFPKHKTGWGVRYPGQGIFTPNLYYWHTMCYLVTIMLQLLVKPKLKSFKAHFAAFIVDSF